MLNLTILKPLRQRWDSLRRSAAGARIAASNPLRVPSTPPLRYLPSPSSSSDGPAPVFKPPTKISAFGVVRLHLVKTSTCRYGATKPSLNHRRACNRFPAILTSPVRPCDGFASLPNASPPLTVLFDPALDFALARQFPMDCRVGDCQPHAKVGSAKTVDKRFPQRGGRAPPYSTRCLEGRVEGDAG